MFVLWFSVHLPVADVLRLEALYYGVVVLLEVPSGWASDRVGRKPLLVASSLCWAMGAALLAVGHDLPTLGAGQVLLAAAMALGSGTDSALHADTLLALDRIGELAQREARARAAAMAALAMSAAIGGLMGMGSLSAPYVGSAVSGGLAAALALAFVEPPRLPPSPTAQPPHRDRTLLWLLGVSTLFTVLVHVPYELMQPWLAQAVGTTTTPLWAGLMAGIAMALGAVAARQAPALHERVGLPVLFLGSAVLLLGIIAAMGSIMHPALLPLLALRSVSYGLTDPILSAAANHRLHSHVRATWLSVQSLVGRLAFAGSLALVSRAIDPGPWTPASIAQTAWPFVAGGVFAVGLLTLTYSGVLRR